MPRPRKQIDTAEIARLRAQGVSYPKIARRMHLGLATVHRAYRAIATDCCQVDANPFQNPGADAHRADPAAEVTWRSQEALGDKVNLQRGMPPEEAPDSEDDEFIELF